MVVVVHIEFLVGKLEGKRLPGITRRIWQNNIEMECGICGVGEYRVLVGKFEGMRPSGITGRRWHDNIKMGLKESFWKGVE
jgi:hypothetical protein